VGILSFFGKKGISPLIATVLIIGFTIALAAIIITWGVGFVTQQTVQTGEQTQATLDLVQNAGVKIKGVIYNDNDPQSEPDNFTFTIENTGSIELDGFLIRAYDDNGDVHVVQVDLGSSKLGPFGVKTFSLRLNNTATPTEYQYDLANVPDGDLIPEFRGALAQFMKVNWKAT